MQEVPDLSSRLQDPHFFPRTGHEKYTPSLARLVERVRHAPWTMFTGRSRLWGFPDFFNPQSCSDLDPRDRAGRLVDRAGLGCGVCNRHTAHCDHSSGLLFSDNDLNISRIPPSPFPVLILYCLLSFPNSSSAIPVAAFLFWVVSLSSSTSHTLSSFLPTPPTLFYP